MRRATPPRLASFLLAAVVAGAWAGQAPAVSAPVTAIPFELATRHIIVPVRVNGSRPLSFVLDTGANQALVQMDLVQPLGLQTGGVVTAGGAGASRITGAQLRDATWTLEGLDRFSQPLRLALPLGSLPPAMGRDVDGIIGGQFIQSFVVEVDYVQRRLRLYDRDTFRYTGPGVELPITFVSDTHPVVTATVTPLSGPPITGKFLLDIGSGLALALHSPTVRARRLLASEAGTVRLIGAGGAGGSTVGRLGRVASLQLGPFTLDQPVTVFSQDEAGAFANSSLIGNIGAQIATRFKVFLDYGRRRIILEPTAAFDAPFTGVGSGASLRTDPDDYHVFRVKEVLEDSPSTDAGLQAGDVITAIDLRSAADLTLSEISELFERPVSYRLTVNRDGRELTLTLTPRKLV